MALIQLVAVRNTALESLEITRWIDTNKSDVKQMEREMITLMDRLYPKISTKGEDSLKNPMIAVGISEEDLEVPRSEVKKLTGKIHFALYEGHCLDPKKLSYFLSEKTTAEGELTLDEVKKILSE